MKLAIIFLTVLVAATFAVEAAEVVNLDFVRQHDGVVPDKDATKPPALVNTLTVYGRLRSSCAMPERSKLYAVPAMGRNGDLDALRLGMPVSLSGSAGASSRLASPSPSRLGCGFTAGGSRARR